MGAKTCILFITIHLVYAVSAQDVLKRVPQGFVGMRGKKYLESSENEFYKRKPQFFVGVKGKKSFDDPDFDKRAPMGFVGMRGKKELYPEFYFPDYERRGSMVGQIEYAADDNSNEYPVLDDVINEFLQKLQSNEVNESNAIENDSNDIEKRAKMHQFFGVRGKKSLPEKRPYDLTFRGKFIGVRGKKDLKNAKAQEVKFLVNGPWPKRRGQMGFFGMRGKKWIEGTSDEVMPN